MNDNYIFKYKQINVPKTQLNLIEPDVLHRAAIRNGYDHISGQHIQKPPSQFKLLCFDIKNTIINFARNNWQLLIVLFVIFYIFYSRYSTHCKAKEQQRKMLELEQERLTAAEQQRSIELELAQHEMEKEKAQQKSINSLHDMFKHYDDSKHKPTQIEPFNILQQAGNITGSGATNPYMPNIAPTRINAGYNNYGIILH